MHILCKQWALLEVMVYITFMQADYYNSVLNLCLSTGTDAAVPKGSVGNPDAAVPKGSVGNRKLLINFVFNK